MVGDVLAMIRQAVMQVVLYSPAGTVRTVRYLKRSSISPLFNIPACKIHDTSLRLQCASGTYSATASTSCTACPAGKYLADAGGGTEALSCTAVSVHARLLLHVHQL